MSIPAKVLRVLLVGTFASPVPAVAEPMTRLVSCDAGSCLQVTGRRADATSTVTINGHAVAVRGSRRWRASLSVDTVRAWAAPFARTITVSVVDHEGGERASAEADLPIGMLGHSENLAMLVVSAK